jgi:hypothetical protein
MFPGKAAWLFDVGHLPKKNRQVALTAIRIPPVSDVIAIGGN